MKLLRLPALFLCSSQLAITGRTHEPGCGKPSPWQLAPYLQGSGISVDLKMDVGDGQGIHRSYLVQVPENYDKDKQHPLLLVFHGMGGTASGTAWYTRLGEPAGSEGWVVVYPEGLGDVPDGWGESDRWRTWNGSGTVASPGPDGPTCTHDATAVPCYRSCGHCADKCWWTTCADDVGFVERILDDMESSLCIDSRRIVATGFSNGGIFLYELAAHAKLSGRLAAIAPVSGLPHLGFNRPPASGLRLFGLWGRTDLEVPGYETAQVPPRPSARVSHDGWLYTSVEAVLQTWVRAQGLSGSVDAAVLTPFDKDEGLLCKGSHDSSFRLPSIVACSWDGGHHWAGAGYEYEVKGHARYIPLASRLIVEVLLRGLEPLSKRNSLGPGPGPWLSASPEALGLSSAALNSAAESVASDVPIRQCWAVFRKGTLVHEQYYHGTGPEAVFEGDSAMKTVSALVMGVAWTQGLFDLDRPLQSYGILPKKPFDVGKAFTDFWPHLTARHLLGMTSGLGHIPPGREFMYNSGSVVQHLELLLAKITRTRQTAKWAATHLGLPLGLPELFAYDGRALSIGGGQPVSCRGFGRLGQLILNRGSWRGDNGNALRLIAEEYIDMMTTPSFPNVSRTYGFFLWLSYPPNSSGADCCYPRWGEAPGCSRDGLTVDNYHVYNPNGTILGDDLWPGYGSKERVFMALGYMTRLLFVIPDHNLVVVSLGNTLSGSAQCDIRYKGAFCDQAYSLSLAWRGIRKLLPDSTSGDDSAGMHDPSGSSLAVHERSRQASIKHRNLWQSTVLEEASNSRSSTGGSCYCYCSPDQGFGSCFNVPSSADSCHHLSSVAAARCPHVGVIQECRIKNVTSLRSQRGNIPMSQLADPCAGTELIKKGNFACKAVSTCSDSAATAGSPEERGVCHCHATAVNCYYDPTPCDPSDPYLRRVPLDLPADVPPLPVAFNFHGGFAVTCVSSIFATTLLCACWSTRCTYSGLRHASRSHPTGTLGQPLV